MAADVERAACEKFGKWLVEEVRDYAISDADQMLRQPPQTEKYAQWLYERLSCQLNDDQQELVRYLIPQIADAFMHNLIWALGDSDLIDLRVKVDAEAVPIMRGDLVAIRGLMFNWIRDYSRQRHDYLDDADSFLPEI